MPAGFRQPTFNLMCNIWRGTLDPLTDPPSLTIRCNLAWGRRVSAPASGGTDDIGVVFTSMVLMVPAGADIRTREKGAILNDVVECPAGTGRYYNAVVVDDIGKGFDNEHRAAVLQPQANWPFPIP